MQVGLEGDKVNLGSVIGQLKKAVTDRVRNYMVSYFCSQMGCYVFVGIYKPGEKENKVSNVSDLSLQNGSIRDAECLVPAHELIDGE